MLIREYEQQDWPQLWRVLEPVFRSGESYAYARDITEQQAYEVWVNVPQHCFVICNEAAKILGSYYLTPNQPGQGRHICNCGYVVAASAQGKGLAASMCEHSQRFAVDAGFKAMQFNLVVASNRAAVYLWTKLGFEVVGRIPEAFQHPLLGMVDALVMYKQLHR